MSLLSFFPSALAAQVNYNISCAPLSSEQSFDFKFHSMLERKQTKANDRINLPGKRKRWRVAPVTSEH